MLCYLSKERYCHGSHTDVDFIDDEDDGDVGWYRDRCNDDDDDIGVGDEGNLDGGGDVIDLKDDEDDEDGNERDIDVDVCIIDQGSYCGWLLCLSVTWPCLMRGVLYIFFFFFGGGRD